MDGEQRRHHQLQARDELDEVEIARRARCKNLDSRHKENQMSRGRQKGCGEVQIVEREKRDVQQGDGRDEARRNVDPDTIAGDESAHDQDGSHQDRRGPVQFTGADHGGIAGSQHPQQ